MVCLFVFVVYRTDPQSSPASQSTGGGAPHPTHLPTKGKGKGQGPATTKTKKRTSHHHHHHRTRPKAKIGIGISFALCSLRKCYLGRYAPLKIPLNADQVNNSLQNCPFLWPEFGRLFALFLSTTAHNPYLSPSQTKKMYFFWNFFSFCIPCK